VSTFDRRGELDPSRHVIIVCCGKKKSGKSVMGLLIFRSYPYDKVVIDVAGDDGPWGPDVVELHGTAEDLPRRWPEHLRKTDSAGHPLPMILRYVPDPGSPTFLEDMDTVVGLVLAHGKRTGHCMALVHEMGRLCPANRTPPHTSRLLEHNRHNNASAIFCGPRSQDIDPLLLMQADLIYTFELQGKADRQRIAENIGWDPPEFSAAVHDLGVHEHLRFDANEPKPASENDPDMRLVHCPALPADVVAETLRWAHGRA
jgi:hypothetical protein